LVLDTVGLSDDERKSCNSMQLAISHYFVSSAVDSTFVALHQLDDHSRYTRLTGS
jgi:hypothetical protein